MLASYRKGKPTFDIPPPTTGFFWKWNEGAHESFLRCNPGTYRARCRYFTLA